MSTSTFIEQLAAGQAADAKETLSNLLSARAFEALDARKQELGATLFGNQVEEEVEGVEESMDQPMSKNLARGYTSNQEHGDKAPKMSDKQKAAAKAARDARDAADMKKYFAKSDAEMRKEEVEELDELSKATLRGYLKGSKSEAESQLRGDVSDKAASLGRTQQDKDDARYEGGKLAKRQLGAPGSIPPKVMAK